MPISNFRPIRLLDSNCWNKFAYLNTKQCSSRSIGFFRSQLIRIYTVCKGKYQGSAGLGLSLPIHHHCCFYSYFPWDYWGLSRILKNQIPLKPVLAGIMHTCKLHCCHLKSLRKPRLPFSLFMCSLFPKESFIDFILFASCKAVAEGIL